MHGCCPGYTVFCGLRPRGQHAELLQLASEPGAVVRVEPRAPGCPPGWATPAASCRPARPRRGELTDADRHHLVGVRVGELAVEHLVVLTVVAEQQPLDLRELVAPAGAGCRACAPCRCGTSGPRSAPSRSAAAHRAGTGCGTGTGSGSAPRSRRRWTGRTPAARRERRDSLSYSTGIPGVAARACSLTTKVCQAASSGRGRAVTITVSSMSETMPNALRRHRPRTRRR